MTASSFPGIARTLYVRPRLRLADVPRPDATDWSLIRGAVDGPLDELSMMITGRRPDIIVRAGASKGGAVLLFAYRTFRLASRPNADPIVAGVTFIDEGETIRARADLCREDSGVIVGGELEQIVGSGEEVEDVAASLAAHLVRSADELIRAVETAPVERA
jgi:hypothetical protein